MHFLEGWMLAIMVGKENFEILDQLNDRIVHSVSLGTDIQKHNPAKHNPEIFSVPSDAEKRNKSVQDRLQLKITPIR